MSSSSFGWPAETWSGSMLHLIRLRNGLHRQITEAFPWNEAPYLRLAPTLVCGRSELSVRPVENSNSGYSWPPGERRPQIGNARLHDGRGEGGVESPVEGRDEFGGRVRRRR